MDVYRINQAIAVRGAVPIIYIEKRDVPKVEPEERKVEPVFNIGGKGLEQRFGNYVDVLI